MKYLSVIAAVTLMLSAGTAFVQSNIRVQPGGFCAINKCVHFSNDLKSVFIQAREPVSVASFNLAADPVISAAEYRRIFRLALIQPNVGGSRG